MKEFYISEYRDLYVIDENKTIKRHFATEIVDCFYLKENSIIHTKEKDFTFKKGDVIALIKIPNNGIQILKLEGEFKEIIKKINENFDENM